MMSHRNGNSQFGLGCWVLPPIAFYLLFESGPILCVALLLVRGAGFKVQLEGLGDGCHRLLNSLNANLIFSSCVSISYPMGKGLDNGKLFWLGESSEEGVRDAKEGDKC